MSCRVNADQDASAMALEVAIERFLTHKRALNRRYAAEEKVLRLFARVLSERGVFTLGVFRFLCVPLILLLHPTCLRGLRW